MRIGELWVRLGIEYRKCRVYVVCNRPAEDGAFCIALMHMAKVD